MEGEAHTYEESGRTNSQCILMFLMEGEVHTYEESGRTKACVTKGMHVTGLHGN
jgi:hypothetical protein